MAVGIEGSFTSLAFPPLLVSSPSAFGNEAMIVPGGEDLCLPPPRHDTLEDVDSAVFLNTWMAILLLSKATVLLPNR